MLILKVLSLVGIDARSDFANELIISHVLVDASLANEVSHLEISGGTWPLQSSRFDVQTRYWVKEYMWMSLSHQ